MKNIYLLPTDKPSRLVFDKEENRLLPLVDAPVFMKHQDLVENQNLYIISDEEIKEGTWVFDNFVSAFPKIRKLTTEEEVLGAQTSEYKIILTTDQDLINVGVQAISNDFLEWFVKNPNCECVSVIHGLFNRMNRQVDSKNVTQNHSDCVWKYKVIIPINFSIYRSFKTFL